MTWKVRVQSLITRGQIGDALFIIKDERDGPRFVVGPLVLKEAKYQAVLDAELIKFDGFEQVDDFLRAFADAAWEPGIKPTAFTDHQGELGATQRHLEDFRKLLFKKEGVE